MKKYCFFFSFLLSFAQGDSKVECYYINQNSVQLTIESDKLNLTEDAIVDNTGGYVDIPEQRYYIKSKLNLFRVKGDVINTQNPTINKFQTIVSIENIKQLKIDQNLTLIQKIDLLENNINIRDKNITTTNNINITLKRCYKNNLE